MKAICSYCGKEYTTFPAYLKRRGLHTCSRKCGGLARRTRNIETCRFCGKKYTHNIQFEYMNKGFCSVKCKRISYFWARVNKTDSCWFWKGEIRDSYGIKSDVYNGYGRVVWKGKRSYAHIVSYYLVTGISPMVLKNRCGNRACVNPEHWQMDVSYKYPNRKLEYFDVVYIRNNEGKFTHRELAGMFNVSESLISAIHNGKLWVQTC